MAAVGLQLFDQRSNHSPFGPAKPNYHTSETKEQEKNEGEEQKKEKRKKSNACTLIFNIGYFGERKS